MGFSGIEILTILKIDHNQGQDQGHNISRDTLKLIFLIYRNTKPNIEVSCWLYLTKILITIVIKNYEIIPPNFMALIITHATITIIVWLIIDTGLLSFWSVGQSPTIPIGSRHLEIVLLPRFQV